MSQQTIGVGTVANDGTGDPLRTAFTKVNANFSELYGRDPFPGYIVGNWYVPWALGQMQTGTAPGLGSIRLYPAYFLQQATLNALGLRVSTLSAGGNVQAAIYANNAATGRPTGTALVSTASMSTAAAGNVNAAVSIQLSAGMYWFATNCDNGTAALASFVAGNTWMEALIGGAAQNDLQTGSLEGLSVTQAFGTWPDLTAASFTEITSVATIPLVQFKLASVP
jgi:hypothetical protein